MKIENRSDYAFENDQHGNPLKPGCRVLSKPDGYEGWADFVGRIQTDISELFIAGKFTYKLKRAVPLAYLDFFNP